jgi:hypothetical protein
MHQIEEASSLEESKHVIIGETCSLCGCSAEFTAYFKSFRCSRTLGEPSPNRKE